MKSQIISKLCMVALFVAGAMTPHVAFGAIHAYTFEADLFGGAAPMGIGSFSFDDSRLVAAPLPGNFTDPAGNISFGTSFGDVNYTGLELDFFRGGPYRDSALELRAAADGGDWIEILLRGPFYPSSNPPTASDLSALFDTFADNISSFRSKQVELEPAMVAGDIASNAGLITSFAIVPEPSCLALGCASGVLYGLGLRRRRGAPFELGGDCLLLNSAAWRFRCAGHPSRMVCRARR
jgi:hypothetical protein